MSTSISGAVAGEGIGIKVFSKDVVMIICMCSNHCSYRLIFCIFSFLDENRIVYAWLRLADQLR